MARYSEDHREQSHRRIVAAGGQLLRTEGLRSPLRSIMKSIDMTKGAFYHHFDSKDAFLLEALEDVFEATKARWASRLEGLSGPSRIAAMLDRYLSEDHLQGVAEGCVVPSILSDLSRVPERLKGPFEGYFEWLVSDIAGHLEGEDRRERASALLSTAIGAITVARGIGDSRARLGVLEAARLCGRRLAGCD